MSGLSVPLPQHLQVIAEDPEIRVAILDQNVVAGASAGDIYECKRVTVLKLVRTPSAACGLRSHWHPCPTFQLASAAVEDLQLEVADQDDLVVAVAIDIMDLEGQIVGKKRIACIRTPGLPEHLAVESDRS